LGHEGAGTVVAAGSRFTGISVGNRVATHPAHPCGQCTNCRHGRAHLCTDIGHFGFNRQGTFAEYFSVRADRARHIPDHVPFTVAALAEPVSVCLEALAQANLPPNGALLILGDGPFGLLMVRLAAALPVDKCVISGRHAFRLNLARGAVQVNVRQADDPLARLRAEAQEGYDVAILVGSPDALRDGLSLLRPQGRMVVFSALSGETPLNLFDLHMRELEIVGACNDQARFDDAITSLSDPALRLNELITHTFPLQAYPEALALAATGHDCALRVAFVF
jgi:threonine dehydrogenase-like Zn-dependent dehydrogenase